MTHLVADDGQGRHLELLGQGAVVPLPAPPSQGRLLAHIDQSEPGVLAPDGVNIVQQGIR